MPQVLRSPPSEHSRSSTTCCACSTRASVARRSRCPAPCADRCSHFIRSRAVLAGALPLSARLATNRRRGDSAGRALASMAMRIAVHTITAARPTDSWGRRRVASLAHRPRVQPGDREIVELVPAVRASSEGQAFAVTEGDHASDVPAGGDDQHASFVARRGRVDDHRTCDEGRRRWTRNSQLRLDTPALRRTRGLPLPALRGRILGARLIRRGRPLGLKRTSACQDSSYCETIELSRILRPLPWSA